MSNSYKQRRDEKLKLRRARARDVLIKRWIGTARVVTKITAARAGWHTATDDHYAAGRLGLMKAIMRYDGIRGAAFATHVWNCVRYAVLDEIKGATWFPGFNPGDGRKLPDARIVSIDSMNIPNDAGDRDTPGPIGMSLGKNVGQTTLTRETADALAKSDKKFDDNELHESLYNAIAQLPNDLREIIEAVDLQGYTQKEVAKKRGISQPAIVYKRNAALKRLRELLEKEAR